MVDAITALGVWDISPERDGIDVLVTDSGIAVGVLMLFVKTFLDDDL